MTIAHPFLKLFLNWPYKPRSTLAEHPFRLMRKLTPPDKETGKDGAGQPGRAQIPGKSAVRTVHQAQVPAAT